MKTLICLLTGIVLPTMYHSAQTVTDYDGNEYETVEIGNQVWLAQNLNSTHYADGTAITEVWAYESNEDTAEIYGRLYTWGAAMKGSNANNEIPSGIQGVCPDGWHLPSKAEWQALTDFLGGEEAAGGKMKEAGLRHWASPNTDATNTSGFTALPGGYRTGDEFQVMGLTGFWWSTTTSQSNEILFREAVGLGHEISSAGFWGVASSSEAYSVRCVKNAITGTRDMGKTIELKIYPNPAKNQATIHNEAGRDVLLKIYSHDGKLVYQDQISSKSVTVDLRNFQRGMYFVNLASSSKTYVGKLLIR